MRIRSREARGRAKVYMTQELSVVCFIDLMNENIDMSTAFLILSCYEVETKNVPHEYNLTGMLRSFVSMLVPS